MDPRASRKSALPLVLAMVIALAGLFIALWPSNATLAEACPWFAKQPEGMAEKTWDMYWSELRGSVRYLYPYTWARSAVDSWGVERDAEGYRLYTKEELRRYDGTDVGLPLLLAINGEVFDVTEKGWQYYGPGMGYSLFAGRDATRSLTLGSLSDEDLNLEDFTGDFDEERLYQLTDQHDFYRTKYPCVGRMKGGVIKRHLRPQPSTAPQ